MASSVAKWAVHRVAACKECRQERPLHPHQLSSACYKWAYRFLHPGYNFIQANATLVRYGMAPRNNATERERNTGQTVESL